MLPSNDGGGESVDVRLEVSRDDGARLVLRFAGVTELRIDDLRSSRPDFLQITDVRAARGFEASSRYSVADCCQGPVSFYCADFSAELILSRVRRGISTAVEEPRLRLGMAARRDHRPGSSRA